MKAAKSRRTGRPTGRPPGGPDVVRIWEQACIEWRRVQGEKQRCVMAMINAGQRQEAAK